MKDDEAYTRLVEQRLRNRIMEELLFLAEGDAAVGRLGAKEYFNGFEDFLPLDYAAPAPNSAITDEENAALWEVCRLMSEAADATPDLVTDEELLASGWPSKIAPVANAALALFLRRGRFSEEVAEDKPSGPSWP
jgi:hypothetical protein